MKTLRNVLALISLCFISAVAFAQQDSLPVYKSHPTIPAFKLMAADSSSVYIKDVIIKNQPTVVIVFSPTCSHCQHQAEEITSHMADLQDVNFFFSTVYAISEMKTYINEYGLEKFKNIHVAHDANNFMGTFYNIQSLPGIYVYNKKGHLVADFNTNVKTETLLEALKK